MTTLEPATRILVCGSRLWTDEAVIREFLVALPANTIIISGAAAGADRITAQICHDIGLVVNEYPADWKKHGRAAGPIRNKQMLDEGKPDRIMAFSVTPISIGTADMIAKAKRARLPVEVTYAHQKGL